MRETGNIGGQKRKKHEKRAGAQEVFINLMEASLTYLPPCTPPLHIASSYSYMHCSKRKVKKKQRKNTPATACHLLYTLVVISEQEKNKFSFKSNFYLKKTKISKYSPGQMSHKHHFRLNFIHILSFIRYFMYFRKKVRFLCFFRASLTSLFSARYPEPDMQVWRPRVTLDGGTLELPWCGASTGVRMTCRMHININSFRKLLS